MKRSALISLLLTILSMAGMGNVPESPAAEKGVLDLRSYNFQEEGILEVEGTWNFFWEDFIDPISPPEFGSIQIPVPTGWRNLEGTMPEIERKGFGSYHLTILLPEKQRRLGIRFTEVFSASAYYVDGTHIGFNGYPGKNRLESEFDHTPSVFFFTAPDSVVNLVVHVSNYEHRSGGIRGSVEIGAPVQLMSKYSRLGKLDAFLVGAFLIIGIYFISMYLIRAEPYKLFFALICIVTAFRIDLYSVSPLIDYEVLRGVTRLRFEYLSFNLLVPLFILLIRDLFPFEFPRPVFNVGMFICTLQILFSIFTPISMFSGTYYVYMPFVMAVSAVLFIVLIRAWLRGRTYAPGFVIGTTIAIAGAVNDMLHTTDIINTAYISHLTLFIYLLVYAIVFSRKSYLLVQKTEAFAEEVNRVNENLEQLVEERTAELHEKTGELSTQSDALKSSNDKLQKILDIKNRMFTVIGHDIRGPLGTTNQMVKLLQNPELSREQQEEILGMLDHSSQATLNLLENLLIWGQSQTGSLSVNPRLFGMRDVAGETLELLEPSLAEKQLKLEINVPENLLVFADPEHIKLVMRNLLHNAVKFTKEKGRIGVSAAKSDDGKEVHVSVSDTGIGIPTVVLSGLFSAETHHTTFGTGKEKGSGIGLKLCKEVIDLNRGWIKATSRTGEGSVFTFGLPAEDFRD